MREETLFKSNPQIPLNFVVIVFLIFGAAVQVCGQSPDPPPNSANPQVNPASAQAAPPSTQPKAPSGEDIQKRIARARALAAAHRLEGAASELESARSASRDAALRDATSVMLMSIYLEAGNYSRAQSLLEETFHLLSVGNDGSLRCYFALAGQTINGLRSHLSRYRAFGVDVEAANMPPEVVNDLDRVRAVLERMAAQAREIIKTAPRANESLALLEDVLGIRASIPRNEEDRARWQGEYTQAREQLGSGRVELASVGTIPATGAMPRQTKPQPSQISTTEASQGAAANGAPPAQSNVSAAQTIDGGILNDKASRRVFPNYPQSAKDAKASGIVRVHVIVNESGEVQVTSSEGPMLLRQAAEEAARAWRFVPTVSDGKPVRVIGYIEFHFDL